MKFNASGITSGTFNLEIQKQMRTSLRSFSILLAALCALSMLVSPALAQLRERQEDNRIAPERAAAIQAFRTAANFDPYGPVDTQTRLSILRAAAVKKIEEERATQSELARRDSSEGDEAPIEIAAAQLLNTWLSNADNFDFPASVTAVVNAASFDQQRLDEAAVESIVAIFGTSMCKASARAETLPLLNELAGVRVGFGLPGGEFAWGKMFFVSPNQINVSVPRELLPLITSGTARITVQIQEPSSGKYSQRPVNIVRQSGGIFYVPQTGIPPQPAALLLRISPAGVQRWSPFNNYDGIDLLPGYNLLILYATGGRHAQAGQVSVKVGGRTVPVWFNGAQGFFDGLDQLNILLPQELKGAGTVEVTVTYEGRDANVTRIKVN